MVCAYYGIEDVAEGSRPLWYLPIAICLYICIYIRMCLAAGGVVRLTATPHSQHKKLTTHEPSSGGLRIGLRDLLERTFFA